MMCGITGWVAYMREPETQADVVNAMLDTLAPRGPDAHSTWYGPHVAMGHCRLAVIDLVGGQQPMTVDVTYHGMTKTVCLIYGGEVYNHIQLRKDLQSRGHRFRTMSDTEVVLRAYLEWGAKFVDQLNGMYALALWDSRYERLVLVRDRLGVKPLFFSPTIDGVVFGSEPKAILAHPEIPPVVDADGMREVCSLVKSRRNSVWARVRQVEPGSIVTVERTGIRERIYWRLVARHHTDSRDITVHHVRALLEDIVRIQLTSDVPRCMLLSGGLDSSILTALAARQLASVGEKARSFVVDFVDQAKNFYPSRNCVAPDVPYANDVARLVGSDHSAVILDHEALADPNLRRVLVRAVDEPFIDDGFSSLHLLFRAIRMESTVVLSGESADEVFGGYHWFHPPQVSRMDPWMMYLIGVRDGWVSADTLLNNEMLRGLDLRAYVSDMVSTAVAEIDRPASESREEWRMRKMLYLHITRMLPLPLDRADRMSMSAGLELRVPYCDHRLVEYVFNVPWEFKTRQNREKTLLRDAAQDLLPISVLERLKNAIR